MVKLLITGGTGLIGKRFCELYSDKYEIHILTRNVSKKFNNNVHYHFWDIDKKVLDLKSINPDYIITLNGEGIADKRWTSKRKEEIINSRVNPILFLKEKLQETGIKPKAIIGASAIGYYGDRPQELLDESSSNGKGFLSLSCYEWEKAYNNLIENTDKLVILRLGTVLSNKGGALPKMLMTKFLRIFNYFGNGKQTMSWIHIDDVCQVIDNSIENKNYTGVINVVSPDSVSNKSFTKTLKNSVSKLGLVLPVPKFILKIMLGEMASILLDDTNVKPKKLIELGYKFKYSNIKSALEELV